MDFFMNEKKSVYAIFANLMIVVCLLLFSRSGIASNDDEPLELLENDIVNVEKEEIIDSTELYKKVRKSKVVYIGETHDNFSVHNVQLEIIKNLYRLSSGEIAIGLEMFQKRSQEKLDLWIDGKISEKEFLKDVWYPDWGFEYEYYRGIIEFAKNNHIKLVALNTDETFVRKVNKLGLDNLSEEEKKQLPEIDLNDEFHRKRVKAVFDVHGQGSMGDFEKFYTVQCLWDETMAESAANYMKSKDGKKKQLIVLAGKDHVRYGLGIPKRVYRRTKNKYSIILPVELSIPDNKKHNIMNVETVEVPEKEADYLWMVEYTDPVIKRVKLGIMVLNSPKGVMAHNVESGSSADKIGIINGDLILEVDAVPVVDPFDLVYEIRSKVAGKSGKINIERDGKEMTLDIVYELGNIAE